MISRRQIIESQQKLNAQRFLLEKQQQQQQQQSKQQSQQQNSKGNIMSKSQNSRQALAKMAQSPEEIVPKGSNKSRQLGKSKQFCVEQEYDIKLARNMRRFSGNNKCFHDENYAHQEIEEENDDNEDEDELEDENDGQDNIDEDEEDEFRAQDTNKHRSNNHNCISHDDGLHEDYRHFDPYSVYGEEDEEEDVWYSEERLFEVSYIILHCSVMGKFTG